MTSLRWRHNDHAGVSNHQPHGCLLNRLFGRKSKKTSKLRVTGLCAGNSPGTGEFPAQMASYAENVSIWWRHHVTRLERLADGDITTILQGELLCLYTGIPVIACWTHTKCLWFYSQPLYVNRPISQTSQHACSIGRNAPFCERKVHRYAHFRYKIVPCDICLMHYEMHLFESSASIKPHDGTLISYPLALVFWIKQ